MFVLNVKWTLTKDNAKRCILNAGFFFSSSFSIQNLISQLKDFDAGFPPLQKKLSAIKAKLDLEKEARPDLLGKKTQLQRLQVHYSNV